MAQRDPIEKIEEEIEKQEEMYGEGDVDNNLDKADIDANGEKLVGNRLDHIAEVGSLYKEAEKDDKNRGNIAPDGSDAQEDEE